jgi:hypothetical protein
MPSHRFYLLAAAPLFSQASGLTEPYKSIEKILAAFTQTLSELSDKVFSAEPAKEKDITKEKILVFMERKGGTKVHILTIEPFNPPEIMFLDPNETGKKASEPFWRGLPGPEFEAELQGFIQRPTFLNMYELRALELWKGVPAPDTKDSTWLNAALDAAHKPEVE